MQSRPKSKKRALRAVIFLLVAALLYGVLTDVLSVNNPADSKLFTHNIFLLFIFCPRLYPFADIFIQVSLYCVHLSFLYIL